MFYDAFDEIKITLLFFFFFLNMIPSISALSSIELYCLKTQCIIVRKNRPLPVAYTPLETAIMVIKLFIVTSQAKKYGRIQA